MGRAQRRAGAVQKLRMCRAAIPGSGHASPAGFLPDLAGLPPGQRLGVLPTRWVAAQPLRAAVWCRRTAGAQWTSLLPTQETGSGWRREGAASEVPVLGHGRPRASSGCGAAGPQRITEVGGLVSSTLEASLGWGGSWMFLKDKPPSSSSRFHKHMGKESPQRCLFQRCH